MVAQPIIGTAPMNFSLCQKLIHGLMAEGFGQRLLTRGPLDFEAWVIVAQAFLKQKSTHLFQRRQAPRARGA